mmetsp:Transcript_52836/g.113180  ORF Transcript_52836/g.113180 Transcript_52836/m.113180 type:complete len:205 (+) Transcript_52836:2282-2896(+)
MASKVPKKIPITSSDRSTTPKAFMNVRVWRSFSEHWQRRRQHQQYVQLAMNQSTNMQADITSEEPFDKRNEVVTSSLILGTISVSSLAFCMPSRMTFLPPALYTMSAWPASLSTLALRALAQYFATVSSALLATFLSSAVMYVLPCATPASATAATTRRPARCPGIIAALPLGGWAAPAGGPLLRTKCAAAAGSGVLPANSHSA